MDVRLAQRALLDIGNIEARKAKRHYGTSLPRIAEDV
jgi:hypothetical protein